MSALASLVESTITDESSDSSEYDYNTSDDDTSYKSDNDASSGYDSFSDDDVYSQYY